jgi:hypothetical protein
VDAIVGGWHLAGVNTMTSGVPVTFVYTPSATAIVSGIAQDFRGANNYRPNVVCDPMTDAWTIQAYFNASCVVAPTIRASRSATRRATACAPHGSKPSIF